MKLQATWNGKKEVTQKKVISIILKLSTSDVNTIGKQMKPGSHTYKLIDNDFEVYFFLRTRYDIKTVMIGIADVNDGCNTIFEGELNAIDFLEQVIKKEIKVIRLEK